MTSPSDRPPSLRVELTGWLAFFLFVGAVYALRRRLDRTSHSAG